MSLKYKYSTEMSGYDVEIGQPLVHVSEEGNINLVRLSLDEKYALISSLVPINFLAVVQFVFGVFCSQSVDKKDPSMWLMVYAFFGLQCAHTLITVKTLFDFYKIERQPAAFVIFFGENHTFLTFRLLSNLILLVFLCSVYADPLLINLTATESLTLEDKRTILGLCMFAVVVDSVSAIRTLLTLFMSYGHVTCQFRGIRECTVIIQMDLMLRKTGVMLNCVHTFSLWLLCGLGGKLALHNVVWERVLLVCAVIVSIIRYFQNGETAFTKCILVLCYALYLIRLFSVALPFSTLPLWLTNL